MITIEYRHNFYTITANFADVYIISNLLTNYTLKNGIYTPINYFDGVEYVLKGDNYNGFTITTSFEGEGFLSANNLYYNLNGELQDFSKILPNTYTGLQDANKNIFITGLKSINLELHENDLIICDGIEVTLLNNFVYQWEPASNTLIILSNNKEII